MKRHNAKAIAAAVAIASANTAPVESKKKTESKPIFGSSALYVDVVKNISKPKCSPPATPPPKFTILREDFPALPGASDDTNSDVPDDWTAMISDDDEEQPEQPQSPQPPKPKDLPDCASDRTMSTVDLDLVPDLLLLPPQNKGKGSCNGSVIGNGDDNDNDNDNDHDHDSGSGSNNDLSSSEKEIPAPEIPAELIADPSISPPAQPSPSSEPCQSIVHVELCPTYIFEKQFLVAGRGQRARNRQTISNIGPPPGFENTMFYGRLRTNRLGMPLGGITFDISPPLANTRRWGNSGNNSSSISNAYGLAGLATNLKVAQKHPHMCSQFFGHDAAGLNVDAHRSACEANKMHVGFAGPLQGGRCPPHMVNYDVPQYYLRTVGQDLPQPKIDEMKEELLFFFFYTFPGDMMQMLASAELAERGWRYHIYERLWVRRQTDNPDYIINDDQESGEYNYFNMMHWKVMARHFDLMPEQMERTITKTELREQYGYHPQMR